MFHEDEHETFPSVHYYVTGGFFDLVWIACKGQRGEIVQRRDNSADIQPLFQYCISPC